MQNGGMAKKTAKAANKKPVKRPTHGGARSGAGRKPANPEGAGEKIAASVPSALVAELDFLAREAGWTRSQAVTEAIRRLVRTR